MPEERSLSSIPNSEPWHPASASFSNLKAVPRLIPAGIIRAPIESVMFHRSRARCPSVPAREGFVLVELLIGLGVILVVGAAAILCMVQLNRQAQIHRLYSTASTALQNQIQEALTDAPYIPQGEVSGTGNTGPQIPSSLSSVTEALNLNTSPPVTGTLTTTVTEPISTGSAGLYVARVTGTVSFTYRGAYYQVVTNTLRASDQ
jgi:type II secretory pathway pseudopilin PulG